MTKFLTAKLELGTERPVLGEAIWVRMTITNNIGEQTEIANPEAGVPPPGMDWKASHEAYQIASLLSFGFMTLAVHDGDNHPVDGKGLMPWVTPSMRKRVLQPHESLVLNFELNELFSINSSGTYRVHARYGDDTVCGEASLEFKILPGATS